MLDEPYYICYLKESLSDRERADSIDCCIDQGLVPIDERGEPISERAEISSKTVQGSEIIDFRYDDVITVGLTFNRGESWDWNEPTLLVSLSLERSHIDPGEEKRAVENRTDDLIAFIAALTKTIQPEYAWGMHIPSEYETEFRPSERPITEHVDRLSWITVLAPSSVEELGGRDRVLATPADRVDELETGHVLVVKTATPFGYDHETDIVDRYLLEGTESVDIKGDETDPRDDPRESGESLQFDDPFRESAAGEIGADVVIEKDAVGGHISNDDLHLRRVTVDENGHLRDLETNEFVRRLYGPDGQIGTLPPDVTTDGELFPPLTLNGVPVEFVRLSDPDGENVLTKCMSLDMDINKFEFLVRLSTSVLTDGYENEDIDAVESLLDSAAALENQDGIGQL